MVPTKFPCATSVLAVGMYLFICVAKFEICEEGIWLPGKNSPVAGSLMGSVNWPDSSAAVGTTPYSVAYVVDRRPS